MKLNVGVIGHFGGNKKFFDGQTVKTKNLTSLLESQDNISVCKVDTFYSRTNKIKLLVNTILCMIRCRHIILMVSVNGMNVFLPLLYYLNKITKKHIYHYVIGSELLGMVTENRKLIKYLNAMDANWFEYETGTQYLRKIGVTNVSTVPNFKMIEPVKEANKYIFKENIYRFCMFSRVMKEKGTTNAINAICAINRKSGRKIVHLDIYGPVDASYENEFKQLLKTHMDCVEYKGIVDSAQSVDVLKNYYALLFPTYWLGEGVPGTVIDAFASGIPVIASDWNANKEIIKHKKQGILYPCEEFQNLEEAVKWSLDHKEEMMQMRFESRKEYIKYMPETVLNTILKEFSMSEQ